MPRRYFNLEEAQALLPRVRRMMGEALQLHGHLRASIAHLADIGHEINWSMLRGEEEFEATDVEAIDLLERSRGLYGALRETVSRIELLGAEVKGVMEGLVDFYSWRDGDEEVLLCWKLGEPEIEFFHGLEEGFAGRRPVEGHTFTKTRREKDPARV